MKLLFRDTTETIKIKDLFSRLEIENVENACKTPPIQINVNTPFGFKRIRTAFRTEKQKSVTTYFGNNKTLKTSYNHRVKSNGEWVYVKDLQPNQLVECESGHTKVTKQIEGNDEILYDISVDDVHCYFSNGIVSHNSWLLIKSGVEAMKQGKNVVHITLELQEKYVGRRYDACFTGIDFQNVTKNKQLVEDSLDAVPGFLQIKYFPVKTISALSIKNYVERLETLSGKKVDLLVVDYADLLKSSTTDRNSNSYLDGGSIYEELRGVAGELGVPCWTASQANRSASNEDFVEADGIADSYKKVMTADVVLSLSRQQPDKVANTARFQLIKNRFGADGLRFVSSFDASCGNIKIFDVGSDEAKDLKARLKDGEASYKNRLKNIWDNMKDDDSDDDLG